MRYRDFPGLLGSSGSLVIELDMRDDISAPPRACPLRGSDAAAFARSSAVLLAAPGSGRNRRKESGARAHSHAPLERSAAAAGSVEEETAGSMLTTRAGGSSSSSASAETGELVGTGSRKPLEKSSLDLNLLPPRGGGASASWKQAGDAPSTSSGRAVPLADPSTAVEPRS